MNKEENQDTNQKINFVLPAIVPRNQNIREILSNINNFRSNDLMETKNNSKEEEKERKNNDIISVSYKKTNNDKNKPNAYIFIQIDANLKIGKFPMNLVIL